MEKKSHFFISTLDYTYLIYFDVECKSGIGKLWTVACFCMAPGLSIVFK